MNHHIEGGNITQPVARIRRGASITPLYAGQQVIVGRSADSAIVLDDPRVSRSHAVLEWNGMGFLVRDLGSINGTFVDGERLAGVGRLLRDGDEIVLGAERLVYEIIRAEDAPLPSRVVAPSTDQLRMRRGARLEVEDGPDQGQVYPLWGETITIGQAAREATWEIRLSDGAIARPHARLERREDGVFLVDLGSAAGTRLNGQHLEHPAALKDGDVIALGETRLVFRERAQ